MSVDGARFVLLTSHAVAAACALVAGVVVIVAGRHLRAHVVASWAMTLLLIPSLGLGFARFDVATRLVFSALGALAVVMTARATGLARERTGARGVDARTVDVIGFNVISLIVAGTIVPVLRLGAGPLLIAIDVVVCVALGRRAVQWCLGRVESSNGGTLPHGSDVDNPVGAGRRLRASLSPRRRDPRGADGGDRAHRK